MIRLAPLTAERPSKARAHARRSIQAMPICAFFFLLRLFGFFFRPDSNDDPPFFFAAIVSARNAEFRASEGAQVPELAAGRLRHRDSREKKRSRRAPPLAVLTLYNCFWFFYNTTQPRSSYLYLLPLETSSPSPLASAVLSPGSPPQGSALGRSEPPWWRALMWGRRMIRKSNRPGRFGGQEISPAQAGFFRAESRPESRAVDRRLFWVFSRSTKRLPGDQAGASERRARQIGLADSPAQQASVYSLTIRRPTKGFTSRGRNLARHRRRIALVRMPSTNAA